MSHVVTLRQGVGSCSIVVVGLVVIGLVAVVVRLRISSELQRGLLHSRQYGIEFDLQLSVFIFNAPSLI